MDGAIFFVRLAIARWVVLYSQGGVRLTVNDEMRRRRLKCVAAD
jgi:hypothetical protein